MQKIECNLNAIDGFGGHFLHQCTTCKEPGAFLPLLQIEFLHGYQRVLITMKWSDLYKSLQFKYTPQTSAQQKERMRS